MKICSKNKKGFVCNYITEISQKLFFSGLSCFRSTLFVVFREGESTRNWYALVEGRLRVIRNGQVW